MLDFQQKRKVRHFLYNRSTLIVLGIAVLVVMHSTWVVYQKQRESQQQLAVSQKRVSELSSRDAELRDQIGRIQTTSGVEAEIRAKFNVAKENEQVVVLVDDTASGTATSTRPTGFWASIKHFFGRK
jgi:cell division protein FtsB